MACGIPSLVRINIFQTGVGEDFGSSVKDGDCWKEEGYSRDSNSSVYVFLPIVPIVIIVVFLVV